MTLQPHREILEFWRAVARFSFRDGAFVFGGRAHSDSVSDAQQLLGILWPATQQPRYRLDVPDRTDEEVLGPLEMIGDRHSAPLRLLRAQTAYLLRYRDADGMPTFTCGEESAAGHECVESFAVGLQFSLAAKGFSRVYRSAVTKAGIVAEADELESLATLRLTTAMIGLLRSFVAHAFDDDSPSGTALYRLIGQEHRERTAVLNEYRSEMAEYRARALEDVTIASVAPAGSADLPYIECGWTWGVSADAVVVDTREDHGPQLDGAAAPMPDPYFTWVAGDAIRQLTSPRTRLLGLLTEEQSRLGQSLQLRLELARFSWARQATFGDHRWPLERLPWSGDSDYTSLLVAAITASELASRTGNTDLPYAYLLRVFGRLAARRAIVRPPKVEAAPPVVEDRRVPLRFGDPDRAGDHRTPGFTTVLFDALVSAAAGTNNGQLRTELTDLAALAWDHRPEGMNWQNTHRLVSGLVTAYEVMDGETGRSGPPLGFVHQLLADADDAFESLPADDGADEARRKELAARLDRARRIIDQHPARAAALLYPVLAELDERL
ncbi:hypothetical protein BJ973_001147 [Actinoplanes tereljensis]|uniref:Uncharacterized protein n=1 Tax=Paractinoplanes tereljensis TaxID=571912 RepID=A0A919TSU8_9ACTN|nr:SCO2524 family protein [Actinoplanes tereljensis]GIF20946.1 hypothetical protein Ate02nite_36760 [Actinoplanes tereljensis]